MADISFVQMNFLSNSTNWKFCESDSSQFFASLVSISFHWDLDNGDNYNNDDDDNDDNDDDNDDDVNNDDVIKIPSSEVQIIKRNKFQSFNETEYWGSSN